MYYESAFIVTIKNGTEGNLIKIYVVPMRKETITYFTEKEEEFANLLIKIGIQKNIAKVLVFLAKTPEATSRAIERGTDMRQPEVSIAMKFLMDQEWIRSRESSGERKGRPIKIYDLAKPFNEIMDCIENDKKTEVNNKLALVQKVREHLH
jgi:predicted transcriptional regulator